MELIERNKYCIFCGKELFLSNESIDNNNDIIIVKDFCEHCQKEFTLIITDKKLTRNYKIQLIRRINTCGINVDIKNNIIE